MRKKTIYFFNPLDYYYISPTTRLYHEMIEATPAVITVNLDNYKKIINKIDNLDLIIFTPFVFLGKNLDFYESHISRLKKIYYAPTLKKINYKECQKYLEIFFEMHKISKNSIALMTEFDLHTLKKEVPILSIGNRKTDYFLMPGPELYDFELHFKDQEIKSDLDLEGVNRGYNFMKTHQNQIISLPHVIANNEFCLAASITHGNKSRLLSVPGASYRSRRAAVSEVLSNYLKEYILYYIDKIIYYFMRILPSPNIRQKILNAYFQKIISDSNISFTCGSTSGYFVRKILEIPAFGACLCTFEYSFMRRLGFQKNVHYLPIEKISDINKYIINMKSTEFINRIQECTLEAHAKIQKHHSLYARQRQLIETIERILQGKFSGSYWDDGEYKFKDG